MGMRRHPLGCLLVLSATCETLDNQVSCHPVVKVDDDSFVMLAELEARLRIMLHENRTEQLCDKYLDKNHLSVVSSSPGPDWVTPS